MKPSSQINIRSWRYVGTTALEDMILGMDECAVRDTHNVVSSDEFYECIAIIVCQMGDNIFAHAAQISVHYKCEASDVWDYNRGGRTIPWPYLRNQGDQPNSSGT